MRWLLLGVLLIPALEIGVFIWAGGHIGAWWVIGLIFLTGAVGITLAKQQGIETWRRAQESMSYGNVPTEQIIDGICIFVGGVFLITPGFITDIVGLILVIPYTRYPLKLQIVKLLKRFINQGTITFWHR